MFLLSSVSHSSPIQGGVTMTIWTCEWCLKRGGLHDPTQCHTDPLSVQINSCRYTVGTASPTPPDRFLFRLSPDPCPLRQNTSTHPTAYHTTHAVLQSSTSPFLLAPPCCISRCSSLFHPEINRLSIGPLPLQLLPHLSHPS